MRNFSNSYRKFILGLSEINHAVENNMNDFIKNIEKSYDCELSKAVDYVLNLKNKRTIVLISGPSASGKTTTAIMLKNKLAKLGCDVAMVSLDNFYKDRSDFENTDDKEIDYESPYALNIQEFKSCMNELMTSGFCYMPSFDFKEKKSKPGKICIKLGSDSVTIIEGIHGLNPIFTKGLPQENIVRIYISVKQGINDYNGQIISNQEIRLVRRLVRDYEKRKSDPEKTLSMWSSVRKGQSAFIYPFKRTSDITINSLHLYELGAMRGIATALLREVRENSKVFKSSLGLISKLERFSPVDLSLVPENSMIREFIGGGIYH